MVMILSDVNLHAGLCHGLEEIDVLCASSYQIENVDDLMAIRLSKDIQCPR